LFEGTPLIDPIFSITSAVIFSEETMFFSHNKSASAAAKFQRNEHDASKTDDWPL
jgi:hypothetical protein